MRKSTINLLCLSFLGLLLFACDQQTSPFGGQPRYDVEGNLARERPIIDNFIATYETDSLYRIYDPNGVIVIVQEEGDGIKPTNFRRIYVNYVAKLLDGTVVDTNLEDVAMEHGIFDENRDYRIFTFTLDTQSGGGAIIGFSLGIRNMRSGSKGELIIPSPWAYRDQERGDIPENSILLFDIEFLGMD